MTTRAVRRAVVAVLGAVLLAGCGSVTISMGRQPDPALLDRELVVGQSTDADVLRVLGPPFGKGRALLPLGAAQRPMTMWDYEYSEAYVDIPTMRDLRSIYLFVYLDEGRFQGYMWFSSLPPR